MTLRSQQSYQSDILHNDQNKFRGQSSPLSQEALKSGLLMPFGVKKTVLLINIKNRKQNNKVTILKSKAYKRDSRKSKELEELLQDQSDVWVKHLITPLKEMPDDAATKCKKNKIKCQIRNIHVKRMFTNQDQTVYRKNQTGEASASGSTSWRTEFNFKQSR